MNSDSERFLDQLTPQPAPGALRGRVLEGVAQALADPSISGRSRWIFAGLAASVFLAIGLNLSLEKAQQARIAEIFGPDPMPGQVMEMSRMVEKVAGPETAAWVQQQHLAALRNSATSSAGFENYWLTIETRLAGKE